jgi:hypothetical protein
MPGERDIRAIDAGEVRRDLLNWMDSTEAGWCSLEPKSKRDLLNRARLYFQQVARSHHIPEADFRPPLRDAVRSILREHGSPHASESDEGDR